MKTELLDAYLCGDLRGESAAFIEAALKSDAALREVYFQQVRMDAALRVLLEDEELAEVTPDHFAAGIMARIASEPPVETQADRRLAKSVLMEILDERGLKPRPLSSWDWVKAAGIAAAAAALLIMGLQSVSLNEAEESSRSVDTSGRFVARVTSEEAGVVWGIPAPLDPLTTDALTDPSAASSREIVNADGWLRPGRLTLKSGVAEITFNSGARVFLEGPAILEVERPNRAFLESGRLTAEVPKPATGFVINTPRVNVVDIGTRFGVSVDEIGDTEVHVMQGVVEVSRLTGNAVPMIVEEGLAVRADGRTRSELQVIDYAGDQFSLRVEGSTPPSGPSFLNYGFNESGGSEIEDDGRGIEGGPFFASLFPDASQPSRPKRSVGRVGGGLTFTRGERFDSPLLAGFESGQALSVSLWVRIPPRPQEIGAHSILSLVSLDQPSESSPSTRSDLPRWRMAWNTELDAGTTGALRVESGEAFLVGSTDLRDGRWHHIGFRFAGGESADVATHLQLYVDGQLEDISGFRGGPVDQGTIHQLRLGGSSQESSFEGAIDEVYAFPEAVSPAVIQKLATEGGNF
ncbi:MAG: FecR domain-containing protein [Verrucomicrobiae bacterium]|nr:FecR domain-containing protein [Verrucomicrobiae bacterium]